VRPRLPEQLPASSAVSSIPPPGAVAPREDLRVKSPTDLVASQDLIPIVARFVERTGQRARSGRRISTGVPAISLGGPARSWGDVSFHVRSVRSTGRGSAGQPLHRVTGRAPPQRDATGIVRSASSSCMQQCERSSGAVNTAGATSRTIANVTPPLAVTEPPPWREPPPSSRRSSAFGGVQLLDVLPRYPPRSVVEVREPLVDTRHRPLTRRGHMAIFFSGAASLVQGAQRAPRVG